MERTLGWVLGTTVLVPQVQRVVLRFHCCQGLLWWLQVVIGGGCHMFNRCVKKQIQTKKNNAKNEYKSNQVGREEKYVLRIQIQLTRL